MELIEGGHLLERLVELKRYSERTVIKITKQLVEAVVSFPPIDFARCISMTMGSFIVI